MIRKIILGLSLGYVLFFFGWSTFPIALGTFWGCWSLGWALETPPIVTTPLPSLHVSGNRIVDPQGAEVRLRGVDIQDPFVLDHDDADEDGKPDHPVAEADTDFARIASWGANAVRLMIYPGFVSHVGIDSYLERYVDRLVDLAGRHRMYAVIDYHPIGEPDRWDESATAADIVWRYPTRVRVFDSDFGRATAFWNAVAARYGRRNHVLFEIWNEPAAENDERFTWAKWRPFGERLNRIVRERSGNIIIAPGPHYTSDLSDVPTSPYSDTNLAYSIHIYPGHVGAGVDPRPEWDRRFGFLTETYPIVVTEWGFKADGDEVTKGTVEGYGRPFMEYMDARRLSWSACAYVADGSLAMWGRDWRTPTEYGAFVRESLADARRSRP